MTTYTGTNMNDTLVGTSADDTFLPKQGVDTVRGGGGFDTLDVNYNAQSVGAESTIYRSGSGSFGGTLAGGTSSVAYDGMSSILFKASTGDDVVHVDATPTGNGAMLKLDGNSGTDLLDVSISAIYQSSSSFVVGPNGVTSSFGTFKNFEVYHVTASGGSNTITTGDADDIITTYNSVDTVNGGSGNDIIYNNNSFDTIDGGTGYDMLYADYSYYPAVSFNDATGQLSNDASFKNIENYEITTGSGDDSFTFTTGRGGSVYGGAGHDTLNVDLSAQTQTGYTGITSSNGSFSGYINATPDIGFGQIEAINYKAGSGSDYVTVDAAALASGATLNIDGGAGSDGLGIDFSALTDDTIFVANPDGSITSNRGTFANFEGFNIAGGAGNDTLGGAGSIYGNAGDDILQGGFGTDTDLLSGGDGNDTASYANAMHGVTVSLLLQGQQQDTHGAGLDTLLSIENLTGSSYDDTLTGDGGKNILSGLAGDDTLIGGAGVDRLIGGSGADVMTGGAAADRFVFEALSDFGTGGSLDRITDFSHAQGDAMVLRGIDADPTKRGTQHFTFVGSTFATGGTDYELRSVDNHDGSYTVQGDINHDGVADFSFIVVSPTALVASDFML